MAVCQEPLEEKLKVILPAEICYVMDLSSKHSLELLMPDLPWLKETVFYQKCFNHSSSGIMSPVCIKCAGL